MLLSTPRRHAKHASANSSLDFIFMSAEIVGSVKRRALVGEVLMLRCDRVPDLWSLTVRFYGPRCAGGTCQRRTEILLGLTPAEKI